MTSDTDHVDETELLTRLRAGDDDAYAAIFREHYPALRHERVIREGGDRRHQR